MQVIRLGGVGGIREGRAMLWLPAHSLHLPHLLDRQRNMFENRLDEITYDKEKGQNVIMAANEPTFRRMGASH